MDAKKKKAIMECSSFDELLNAEYGEHGQRLVNVLRLRPKHFVWQNA